MVKWEYLQPPSRGGESMSTREKLITAQLGMPAPADELQNILKACRMPKVSRSYYYETKKAGLLTPTLDQVQPHFATLFQNYPNPFNPSTTIGFFLPNRCQVTLEIYDTSGRLITRLLDRETKPAGTNAVEWRGLDDRGRAVSSGVYFCRLRAGKETISKKMTLLK
jgi:hypothetical protein